MKMRSSLTLLLLLATRVVSAVSRPRAAGALFGVLRRPHPGVWRAARARRQHGARRGPVATMTVDGCMAACSASGFLYAGLTGRVGHYYCYCSCAPNPRRLRRRTTRRTARRNAPRAPGSCGGDGAMAAYGPITCTPAKPPSHTCGPPAPPLPAGPACSQAASRAFGFCNTSLSLETRVADLVRRISVGEAGALLTARESPAIPRLGIPAFYWGTNALHGVEWGNATSFPQTVSLASTWNRSLWRGVGRVVGRGCARCTMSACRTWAHELEPGDQRSARPTMGAQPRGRVGGPDVGGRVWG